MKAAIQRSVFDERSRRIRGGASLCPGVVAHPARDANARYRRASGSGGNSSTGAYAAFAMSKKTQVRQLALQLLFLFDAHGGVDEQMASTAAHDGSDDPATRMRATEMARGA